jgi:hypothetical protein
MIDWNSLFYEAETKGMDYVRKYHPECHTDCGPIVAITEEGHAHENKDGRCWHDPEDNTP